MLKRAPPVVQCSVSRFRCNRSQSWDFRFFFFWPCLRMHKVIAHFRMVMVATFSRPSLPAQCWALVTMYCISNMIRNQRWPERFCWRLQDIYANHSSISSLFWFHCSKNIPISYSYMCSLWWWWCTGSTGCGAWRSVPSEVERYTFAEFGIFGNITKCTITLNYLMTIETCSLLQYSPSQRSVIISFSPRCVSTKVGRGSPPIGG